MNNNETLTIPTGTNREDIKERERIISDVYRRWYEKNHRSYKGLAVRHFPSDGFWVQIYSFF